MSWIFSKVLMDSLNLPCSQGLVAESLLQKDLESGQSVQLSVSTTQHPFLHNGKIQETSNLSRFGLTSRVLTEKHGEELILSLAASHAKIYQSRARKQVSQEKGQGFGLRWQESLPKSNLDLFSSKTSQPSENILDISCTTLPSSGTMRNGAVSAQKKLGDCIKEIECGYWLTPSTIDIAGRSDESMRKRLNYRKKIGRNGVGAGCLSEQVRWSGDGPPIGYVTNKSFVPDNENFFHTPNTGGLDDGSNSRRALKKRQEIWPTPDASQRGARSMDLVINQSTVKRRTSGQKRGIDLQTAVKFNPTNFPTPTAHMSKEGGYPAEYTRKTVALTAMVLANNFPTPQASDNRDRGNMSNPSIQRRVRIGKQLNLSQSVHPTNGKLNPDWVEFLMGWDVSWTDLTSTEVVQYPLSPEPEGLPRVCESTPTRTPRLKCIGNGQVPQCAATAYQLLLERLNEQS